MVYEQVAQNLSSLHMETDMKIVFVGNSLGGRVVLW